MPIQNLDPRAAHEAMSKDAAHGFVDVRTPEEYDQGHPAGAVNVPIAVSDPRTGGFGLNPAFVSTMQKLYPASTTIYASCRSGIRSMNACRALESAGYSKLVNVDCGFGGKLDPSGSRVIAPGWRESGLPVDSTPSTWPAIKA